MDSPVIQFIVFAVLAAIFLWVLSQFPTLDPTVVKFIRIIVLVILSLLALNLVLVLLFGQGLSGYLGPHR